MYEDDSSRFITGYGIFDHATSENAVAVLKQACEKYGKPYSIITDHGTQFYALEGKRKRERGRTQFEQHLEANGIRHILARVGHPQTNGKMEMPVWGLQVPHTALCRRCRTARNGGSVQQSCRHT